MAIAHDTSTAITVQTNSSSVFSFNHTVSGDDRIMFACVGWRPAFGSLPSITYNGDSFTLIDSHANAGNDNGVAVFFLIAPDTGTHSVTVTPSGNSNIAISTVSYTGVNQSTSYSGSPTDIYKITTDTTTTSFTQTLDSTRPTDSWMISSASGNGGLAITAGANTTVINQPEVLMQGTFNIHTNAIASSDSMNVTSSSQGYHGVMATFSPVPAPSGPATLKTLNTAATATIKTINGAAIATVKTINTAA